MSSDNTNLSNEQLTKRLAELVIAEESIATEKQQITQELLIRKSSNRTANRSTDTQLHNSYRFDRNGAQLNIGDRVSIITRGKYHSSTGIVHEFTDKRVTIKDKRGIKISRKSSNLQKLE